MSDPVQMQLDAYSARDLEVFISCYATDVVVTEPDGTPMLSGHQEMRVRYGALFGRPGVLHADVPHRVRAGSWTVDHEHLVSGDLQMEALVAYQVHDGLITRVVILT